MIPGLLQTRKKSRMIPGSLDTLFMLGFNSIDLPHAYKATYFLMTPRTPPSEQLMQFNCSLYVSKKEYSASCVPPCLNFSLYFDKQPHRLGWIASRATHR